MAVDNFEDATMQEMMEALNGGLMRIHSGDVIEGTVISVTSNEVFVNIGYMADGIITKEELSDEMELDPREIVKTGDKIYVYVLEVNDGEGNVALSKKRAESFKVWDELEAALKDKTTFQVKIAEAVKGGIVAKIKGVRAFIPASQISTSYIENLEQFVGKDLSVRVMELDKEKERIILSGKEVEKEKENKKKEEVWDTLAKGDKRKGKVSRLAKFGAFVDLGGVDGLIHISDLSWRRVKDPSEVVSVGDWVEVYVKDLDREKGRISLDLKEVSANPWKDILLRYKVGNVVKGTITRLVDFGAFVEIEAGIEGLVHISQISEERITKPSSVLKVGEEVNVKILEVNEEEQRLSLSIKEALEKQEEEDFSQYVKVENSEMTSLGDVFKEKLKGFKFEE